MLKNASFFGFLAAVSTLLSAPTEVRAIEFNLSLGAEYLSNLSKRGMTLYDSFQVIPIYALDPGFKHFVIVGSGAYYRNELTDRIRYRSIINLNATGDKPLYETRGVSADTHRPITHEWDNVIEIEVPGRGEASVALSQDLSAHKGRYLQAGIRVILYRPSEWVPNLEPAVFGNIGGGTVAHNRYLYGSGAEGGLSHYEYGVSLSLPPNIDRYFPILYVKRFGILGTHNQNASLVVRESNTQIVALFAFKVWSHTEKKTSSVR